MAEQAKVMWLCRAAWYLGHSVGVCEAATISVTGRATGWPKTAHSKCGWVGVTPFDLPCGQCDGTGDLIEVYQPLSGDPPERSVERCPQCNGSGVEPPGLDDPRRCQVCKPPCPRDTDGDGNCGQRACPVCSVTLCPSCSGTKVRPLVVDPEAVVAAWLESEEVTSQNHAEFLLELMFP